MLYNLYREILTTLEVKFMPKHLADFSGRFTNIYDIIEDLTIWNIAHATSDFSDIMKINYSEPYLIVNKKEDIVYLVTHTSDKRCTLYNPQSDKSVEVDTDNLKTHIQPWVILIEKTFITEFKRKRGVMENLSVNISMRRPLQLVVILILCIFTLVLYVTSQIQFMTLLFIIVSSLGVVLSYLYIAGKGEKANAGLISKICSNLGGDGCQAITQSKYSNVFGFSIISIALAYYILCVFLSVLPSKQDAFGAEILLVLTLAAMIIGVFLLFVQICVVKKICILCCMLLLVIVFQFSIVWGGYNIFVDLSTYTVAMLSIVSLALANSMERNTELKQNLRGLNDFVEKKITLNYEHFRDLYLCRNTVKTKREFDLVLNEFEGDESLFIEITVSAKCSKCTNYLDALLEVTNISSLIRLSLKVYSHQKGASKYESSETIEYVDDNLLKKIHSLSFYDSGELVRSEPFDKAIRKCNLIKPFSKYTKPDFVSYFPYIIINGRELNMVYSPSELKRNIVLSQYDVRG